MSTHDITRLLALGINTDEIWCAIAEPGPWTLTLTTHDAKERA